MPSGIATVIEGSASTALDELLLRIQVGDRTAFSTLYRLTSTRVFGLIRQILRDPAQSEEVSQEVYLEIWQTASRFDSSKGKCLTWIFTLAHRRAVDRVRASQASRSRDLRIGVRNLERDYDSVAEQVEVQFESDRVREAMSGLSEIQRRAIELSYFGGYTHIEVAALAGIPVGTAKTRLRDGLLKLREALAEPAVAARVSVAAVAAVVVTAG